MLKSNEIYNLPCEEGLIQLDNESIDFVCIDPPYTDGNGNDVLNGHKIQTKLNILAITKEHYRVLKPNSFYAVFGQMPTILAWYNAAIESGFKFIRDIIWAKRTAYIRQKQQLGISHELIYLFSKGNANYHKIDGHFDDIAFNSLPYSLMNIDTVLKEISSYKTLLNGGKLEQKRKNNKRNDDIYYDEYEGEKNMQCRNTINIKTVWSFYPHNKKYRNAEYGQIKHPTVKSIQCLERLIELCTPETPEIIVLDSFIGSGTTYLACQNTNRRCIGFEIAEEYYLLSKNRAAKNVNLFMV